jgi:hypothetical protein
MRFLNILFPSLLWGLEACSWINKAFHLVQSLPHTDSGRTRLISLLFLSMSRKFNFPNIHISLPQEKLVSPSLSAFRCIPNFSLRLPSPPYPFLPLYPVHRYLRFRSEIPHKARFMRISVMFWLSPQETDCWRVYMQDRGGNVKGCLKNTVTMNTRLYLHMRITEMRNLVRLM